MIDLAFTRPSDRMEESLRMAREMGINAIAAPSLIIRKGDADEFERLSTVLPRSDILIFASESAVDHVLREMDEDEVDLIRGKKVISIGPVTRDRLMKSGISSIEPHEHNSDGVVRLIGDEAPGKVVVTLRSNKGSSVIRKGLTDLGAEVHEILAYKVLPCSMGMEMEVLLSTDVRCLALTSPASVDAFMDLAEEYLGKAGLDEYIERVKVAVIGLPTKRAIEEHGYVVDILPKASTFKGLLLAIKGCEE